MDDKEILSRATAVIADTRAGLLTTVGTDGRPNVRWMATHALVGASGEMITITGPDSIKVAEIRANPNVAWLFSRVNFTEIVKLRGVARIDDDPLLKSKAWDLVGHRTWRYFTIRRENPEFTVLVTRIDEVEYYAPGMQMFEPVRASFAPAD